MTATIAVHEFISLDGVFESPTWTFEFGFDPADGRDPRRDHRRAPTPSCSAGRRTRCSRPAWRDRTVEDDPGAPFFNETEKFVVGAQRAGRGVEQHHPPRRLRRRRDPPAQGRARRRHLHLRQRHSWSGPARATGWSTTCTCSSTRSRSARARGSGPTGERTSSRSRRTTSTTTASCTWTTAPPEVSTSSPDGGHAEPVEVRFLDGHGVRRCDPDDVVELFAHDDGFYWIDVPVWDDEAESLLSGLGCHPMVLEGCRQRNYVPTVHGYEDHVFITTQSPLPRPRRPRPPARARPDHRPPLPRHRARPDQPRPRHLGQPWSRPRACWPGSRAGGSTRRRRPSCRTPSPPPSRAGRAG